MITQDQARFVEFVLKDSKICGQCGATLETYGDKCNAPLGEACEGFRSIEITRNAYGLSHKRVIPACVPKEK